MQIIGKIIDNTCYCEFKQQNLHRLGCDFRKIKLTDISKIAMIKENRFTNKIISQKLSLSNEKSNEKKNNCNSKMINLQHQTDNDKENISQYSNLRQKNTQYWCGLEEIQEVPDMITTSNRKDCKPPNSGRERVSYHNPNKKLSIETNQHKDVKSTKEQSKARKSNNTIKQRIKKSNNTRDTMKEKTKSTIELSRVKTLEKKRKPNQYDLHQRTQRAQKSIKLLWDCMGQLWENTKISQYMSQKNQGKINSIAKIIEQNNNDMIELRAKVNGICKH